MVFKRKTLIAVVGPTASGKTAAAIALARHFNTEIISFDSRQFYNELNIGTAKPSSQELQEVKHHLIGHLSIQTSYSAADFAKEADDVLAEIFQSHDIAIAVGGSGLFLQSWVYGLDRLPPADEAVRTALNDRLREEGIESLQTQLLQLDPDYYDRVDRSNPRRIIRALEVCLQSGKPYSSFLNRNVKERNYRVVKIGLLPPRDMLYQIINERTEKMIERGLIEEAKGLYPFRHLKPLHTVGYTELFHHFSGNTSLPEAIDKIKQHTRQYAKRQITWFKKDPTVQWFSNFDRGVIDQIEKQIASLPDELEGLH